MAEPAVQKETRLFESITPNKILDWGYFIYAAEDEHTPLANRFEATQSRDFLRTLDVPGLSFEDASYLTFARGIAVSVSRDYKRLGDRRQLARLSADDLYASLRHQANASNFVSALFAAVWQYAGSIAMGAIGYALMVAFSDFMPDFLLNRAGKTSGSLSFAAAAIFFVVSKYTSTWLVQYRSGRMRKNHNSLGEMAEKQYAQGKAVTLNVNWQKACRLYRDYTGIEWTERPVYLLALESDLAMNRERTEMFRAVEQGDLSVLASNVARKVSNYRQRRKNVNGSGHGHGDGNGAGITDPMSVTSGSEFLGDIPPEKEKVPS